MSDATARGTKPALPATLAVQWLDTDQHGAQVLATARQLLAAEHVLQSVLPAALQLSCRVARIERQHITLAVPGAAYASRLRQLAPRLLTALNEHGWNLTELGVRVQGALHKNQTKTAQRTVAPLDETALAAFDTLHENVPPGPLADAIARLIVRHRNVP